MPGHNSDLPTQIHNNQVLAGEAVVIASLERKGLGAVWSVELPKDSFPTVEVRHVEAPTHAQAEALLLLVNAKLERAGFRRAARLSTSNFGMYSVADRAAQFDSQLAAIFSAA